MKKLVMVIFGALLVAMGVYGVLNVCGFVEYQISLDGWWTLFIIAPSLCGLASSKDKTGNVIILAVGVYLLLAARGIIEYAMFFKLFVPTVIAVLGIKIIVKTLEGSKEEDVEDVIIGETVDEDADNTCIAAFSGQDKSYKEKEVKNMRVAAIFGGAKCNLTDAKFDKESKMDLLCVFGGADIIVPENVEVELNTICLFGGISDKRGVNQGAKKDAKLVVNGFCMFGGADIK